MFRTNSIEAKVAELHDLSEYKIDNDHSMFCLRVSSEYVRLKIVLQL